MKVYVDASGDSGTKGKGTRWLVIAAAADFSTNGELADCLQSLRVQSPHPDELPIHFTGRAHVYKRAVLEGVMQHDWIGIVVASDTRDVRQATDFGLAIPQRHYNYAMSYVLERASQLAKSRGEDLEFIIEEAGNFNDQSFKEYVTHIRDFPRSPDHMAWDVVDIDRIYAVPKQSEHLLSVADGLAHSFYLALEPDRTWQSLEPYYARIVAPKLWCWPQTRTALRKGFTFMPTPQTTRLLAEYPDIASLVLPR